ncbi:uncharacterized protein LOC144428011 [Styela clava]
MFHRFATKKIYAETEDIDPLVRRHLDADITFLTDYESYFIAVFFYGRDWNAFVKAKTPRINVFQLQKISEVLVDNGFISPTMTLKNECINQYPPMQGQPGAIVISEST